MSIGLVPSPAAPVNGGRLVAERLSDRLAALLAAQLDKGGLKPGDRLPSEQQLAESHGVSRTVVREAVHQLKSRGLLVSRQGSGVYVAAPEANKPLAFDPSVLESVGAVVHVVEVRRVLEGEIAALAAQRATRTQVAGLK
ncbi:MAG: FadR family transcriptional regulator, partial [Burkholderiaceae bacterium]